MEVHAGRHSSLGLAGHELTAVAPHDRRPVMQVTVRNLGRSNHNRAGGLSDGAKRRKKFEGGQVSNRELPMMPWFPSDFASATSTWSFAERSAYRALLDVQWDIGVLPDEPWRLAQAIGMALAEFAEVWPMVRTKFVKVEGGLRNERLEEHRLVAFRKMQAHKAGADATNAKRRANRGADHDAERDANRTAQRSSKRVARDTPPSPSPSEDPPNPPNGGLNGANAPANRRPRRIRDASLEAWRAAPAAIDRVRGSEGTWDDVRTLLPDPLIELAIAQLGEGSFDQGCRRIANRDRFTSTTLQGEFRQLYEQLAEQEGGA